MFIAHGEWFRRNTRWILAILMLILIPSFIALFTTTSGTSARQEADLPTVQGKPVNTAEYDQAHNAVVAWYVVNTINTGRELPHTAEFEDAVKQQAVVRMLEFRKARELGVRVPDNDVIQMIRSQPFFLNEARQFDPDRYRRFIIYLNTRGISEAQFEQITREQLMLAQLEMLITAAVKVTPQEVILAYAPLHEKLWIELVAFNAASNAVPVIVTDDEARAFFEKNKEAYRVPKQVKVRYAYLAIAEEKKSVKIADSDIAEFYERNKTGYADTNNVAKPLDAVKDKVREDLLKLRADRLAQDRATELTVKLVQEPGAAKPDFANLCSASGITPQETEFFSLRGKVPGIQAGPQFNQAAFALTPEILFSDPVPGEDGYYVLEYLAAKPSEIPPFEQVKGEVIDQLKRQKTYEATVKQGEDALAQVKKLIAEGKTFDQACAELKLKIESPGPFTLSDEKLDSTAASRIQQTTLGMATNTVSEFIATENGGLFFHLKDRQPPEPAEFEKDKADFAQQVLQRDRQAMYQSWVSALIRSERVNFGRLRSREQQPEPVEAPEAEPTPAPVPAPAPAKS
jgi:peptidyl-prolyl cis-trans isomerase D